MLHFPAGGYTGASPAVVAQRAYYGTFNNEVMAADLGLKRIIWRYQNRTRSFPFYSSPAALGDRIVLGGRDKLVHCLNAKTGKAIWTFHHSRPGGFVASDRGRPCVYRIE